jgi:hypothetical protein
VDDLGIGHESLHEQGTVAAMGLAFKTKERSGSLCRQFAQLRALRDRFRQFQLIRVDFC